MIGMLGFLSVKCRLQGRVFTQPKFGVMDASPMRLLGMGPQFALPTLRRLFSIITLANYTMSPIFHK